MSAVNVAEVAQYFIGKKGIAREHIELIIKTLIQDIVGFEGEYIYSTSELILETKQYGLSLADRTCIALGLKTGYPNYTTDKAWSSLKIDNLKIIQLR